MLPKPERAGLQEVPELPAKFHEVLFAQQVFRLLGEKALHSFFLRNNQAAPERWPSGRRRSPAKGVYVKSVSWVRIPSSPPSVSFKTNILFCIYPRLQAERDIKLRCLNKEMPSVTAGQVADNRFPPVNSRVSPCYLYQLSAFVGTRGEEPIDRLWIDHGYFRNSSRSFTRVSLQGISFLEKDRLSKSSPARRRFDDRRIRPIRADGHAW